MLVINEAELREISKEHNLVKGAKKIMAKGPRCIVAKRGEYGVLMVNWDEIFLCPAYPLEDVFDPTGAHYEVSDFDHVLCLNPVGDKDLP